MDQYKVTIIIIIKYTNKLNWANIRRFELGISNNTRLS